MTSKQYQIHLNDSQLRKSPNKTSQNPLNNSKTMKKKKFVFVFKDEGMSNEMTDEALQVATQLNIDINKLKLK